MACQYIGFGDKRFDCNSVETSDDDDCDSAPFYCECKSYPHYIHAIENSGSENVQITSVTVERDGSASKKILTQETLSGDSTRLIEEFNGEKVDFCEKKRVVTETTVEVEDTAELICFEDADPYIFGAEPKPPVPALAPTTFSYELSTFGFEQDRETNVTDCELTGCDTDILCGYSGYAADATDSTQDWLMVTKGIKAACYAENWYLLEGPYCPRYGCSGRCHLEVVCSFRH